MKKKKSVLKIFLYTLLFLSVAVFVVGVWVYSKYGSQIINCRNTAIRLAKDATEETFRSTETTLIYYADGKLLSALSGEKEVYYLDYDSIPKYAISAMLAIEDRKFYTHSGYDVYAILRAARAYMENRGEIHQGGSTITQQLARTIFLNNEKTIERKATEIFLAAELEKKFSKNQIIEFYLNNIYFANGFYGIQAASQGYFGKTISELSLSQTAFLCAIPNNPSLYNPVTRFSGTIERRDSVLQQMYENGYITDEEYGQAINEDISIRLSHREIQNYEETYVFYCVIRELMRMEGFTLRNTFIDEADKKQYEEAYEEAYYRIKRSLYTKGYRIYTSLNEDKQRQLQEAVDNRLAVFDDKKPDGVYELQASATCIDNDTGRVVAIIGGRGDMPEGYTLNRAFQSPRQPGSAIKPLIIYTPLFERDYYPDTIVNDERFQGGPRNSGGVYSGEIPLRQAIAVSKNTVAWKLFEELTPKLGLSYLLKMGFGSIVESDYVPAASLGGLTYGVTSVEMTSAYAAIANRGIFRSPTCILMVTDADGKIIIDNSKVSEITAAYTEGIRIYDENASLMMTDTLKTVMETGTGRKLRLSGMTCAGKTGTTNDQKDGWFVGFTEYYTTGVWVGCDTPKEIEDLRGNTYPEMIWNEYMEIIHSGLADREFEMYKDDRGSDGEGKAETEDEYFTQM